MANDSWLASASAEASSAQTVVTPLQNIAQAVNALNQVLVAALANVANPSM